MRRNRVKEIVCITSVENRTTLSADFQLPGDPMRTSRDCFAPVVTVFCVLWVQAAHGDFDQWQYWASSDTATKFDNESEAAAHLLEGPAWWYQYLTKPGDKTMVSKDTAGRKYIPAPVDPVAQAWNYQSCYGGTFSSEQEAYDACWSHIQSTGSCGYLATIVSETGWTVTGSFLGVESAKGRQVYYDSYYYNYLVEPHCFYDEANNPHYFGISASRSVGCPSGYVPDFGLGKCVLNQSGFVYGKPLMCGPLEGNPCDVGNGTKLINETDYRGPGVEFTRHFNSLSDFSWRHTYSAQLIASGSTATGLITETGHDEPFRNYGSGQFVSHTGSGIEARLESGEWVIYYPSGARDYFNTSGVLLRRANAAGQATTVNRDGNGRIESIVGPFGHTLTIEYDTDGRMETITDPDGGEIQYEYTGGNLTKVTYPDTTYRQYEYDDLDFPSYVTGIVDENDDDFATYAYDDDGRAISSEHAGGQGGIDLAYNSSNTVVTDSESNVKTYNFATNLFMRKVTSVTLDGGTKSYTYPAYSADNQLRPLQVTDENGVITKYTYDTHHKTSETQAFGTGDARTLDFTYLDAMTDRLTNVTSPSVYSSGDREVDTTYNTDGLPELIEISGYTPSGTTVSRSTSFEYNDDGQLVEIDGPRTDVSDITTLEYNECTTGDECGQLASVTNALGHETTFDLYDAHGRLLEMADANNVVTEYTYDLRGRLASMTETPPSGPARITTYEYDDAGQLITFEAPNGMVLTYSYDEAHNLESVTDNDGNVIEYSYDLKGNRTGEDIRDSSQTLKKTAEYAYDARNRLESITSGSSVTGLVFDALGNLTDETDPNSNDTTYDHDPLNRLIETLDALSGATDYGYNVNDSLTSVEAPNGATTTYVYDDLGNLLSVTSPDTGMTTYTYDAAGNRLTQTDANNVNVEYTYDALNRLTGIEYPNSSLDVTLTYDEGTNQKGHLTTMADGSGTTTFSYDVYGNLTQESKYIDGNTHVTTYTYDAANLLESITYPSGRTVDYTRNSLGQITEVETTYDTATITVADSITYEPFGPLAGLTFGNDLTMSRDYDAQYRLTNQTTGAIQDLSFTLDAAGNIDAIADGVNGSLSRAFTQDELHRIDYEDGAYGEKEYTYDEVGNRLARVHDTGSITTQTLTYVTDSNRLATHDGNTVTLDSAGNMTADPAEDLSFIYDDHNRLIEAYVSSMLQASYIYNALGQRVKKVEAAGGERTFVLHYGINGELLGETVYDDQGSKIAERDYLWLDALPMAQSERTFSGSTVTSDEFVYIHTDELETPRLATDDSGAVVWRWDSDAFGLGEADLDPDSDTNEVDIRLRFPGQYFDEETGLHYNYFRDYDPITGRYVESDPIGLHGGVNTYAYALQNPIGFFDMDGLEVRFICRMLRGPAALTGGQHCFVFVSCPEEGWSNTFSLFGVRQPGDGIFPSKARKSYDSPTSINTDDPVAASNTFNERVIPDQCPTGTCEFEKAVVQKFHQFPTGLVDYDAVHGPNSNSFARTLATGTRFGGRIPRGHPTMINATAIQMDHPGFPK